MPNEWRFIFSSLPFLIIIILTAYEVRYKFKNLVRFYKNIYFLFSSAVKAHTEYSLQSIFGQCFGSIQLIMSYLCFISVPLGKPNYF